MCSVLDLLVVVMLELQMIQNYSCLLFGENWKYRRAKPVCCPRAKPTVLSLCSSIIPFISMNWVISWSFHFCFKIIQIIGSTFKLRSSVMLGVFKMQDVFLSSWETARSGAPVWLHSLQRWTGFSCRLLVRWEAGKKHKKELMCSWKKDRRDSRTFYLASPVLKVRFLSLCSF